MLRRAPVKCVAKLPFADLAMTDQGAQNAIHRVSRVSCVRCLGLLLPPYCEKMRTAVGWDASRPPVRAVRLSERSKAKQSKAPEHRKQPLSHHIIDEGHELQICNVGEVRKSDTKTGKRTEILHSDDFRRLVDSRDSVERSKCGNGRSTASSILCRIN